jgi:aspartate kinase
MPRSTPGAGASARPDKPVVVMKFGGTSVATGAGRASLRARVRQRLDDGHLPVVVVSAMGRRGAPYATDTLLDLVDGCDDDYGRDLVASVGEIVSAAVCAHELSCDGIPARPFTGADAGIVTDGVAGGATIEEIYPALLLATLADGIVPVVAGFQGIGPDGLLTTLGRGGSDTTACALGVALEADEVEIYTDVDGVMTADPRVCDGAEVLERIGADELFQMARHGSRVVHTPAAELAMAAGLDLRVRNTFTAEDGTLVVVDIAGYRPDAVATAVSHSHGVVRFEVPLPASDAGGSTVAQARVYRAMAAAGVSLDMFTPFAGSLAFSVPAADAGSGTSKRTTPCE